MSAFVLIKLNCTWDDLAAIARRSEKALRRDFCDTAKAVRDANIVDANIRFRVNDANFPFVTALVDGSPVPCRQKQTGDSNNYAPKYKVLAMKVELWTTVTGVPFAWRGPVSGSHHDTEIMQQPLPFHHRRNELFLTDLGYVGCMHCLTPFKSNESGGKVKLDNSTEVTISSY